MKGFAQAMRWVAIRKVIYLQTLQFIDVVEMLKFVWGLEHVLNCKETGNNVFIFYMLCMED